MHLIRSKKKLKNKRILEISFLASLILILFLIQIANVGPSLSPNNKIGEHQNHTTFNDKLKIATDDPILFEGNEIPLNITDFGNLYELNQEVSLTNQEELNLTYYLDDEHDWKVSKIQNSIKNIQDTRNWINSSDLQSPNIWRKYITLESDHPYDWDNDETKVPNRIIISETGALYMRIHFINITFERYFDFLFLYDKNDEEYLIDDVNKTNFYSPWIPGDTIKINYHSDNLYEFWGYKLDFYEFLNESSNININNNSWGFNYKQIGTTGKNYYGSGTIGNVSAMHVDLYSEYVDYGTYAYEEGAFSEIYQNVSIVQ